MTTYSLTLTPPLIQSHLFLHINTCIITTIQPPHPHKHHHLSISVDWRRFRVLSTHHVMWLSWYLKSLSTYERIESCSAVSVVCHLIRFICPLQRTFSPLLHSPRHKQRLGWCWLRQRRILIKSNRKQIQSFIVLRVCRSSQHLFTDFFVWDKKESDQRFSHCIVSMKCLDHLSQYRRVQRWL